MPVRLHKRGNQYCVEDASGKSHGCHDDRGKAMRQARAINANMENKSVESDDLEDWSLLDLLDDKAIDEKMDYESDSRRNAMLSQREAMYTTLSGTSGQACANCRFFTGDSWRPCIIVKNRPDPVLATGRCDRWETTPQQNEPFNVREEDGELIIRMGQRAAKADDDYAQGTDISEDKDKDKNTDKKQVAIENQAKNRPDSTDKNLDKSLYHKAIDIITKFLRPQPPLALERPFGFKLHPTDDNRWVAWWTNNFEDRDKEIFSEKSINKYVDLVNAKKWPMPELWVGHIAGSRHGQADAVVKMGHFALATGTFDNPEENWLVSPMKKFYRDAAQTLRGIEVSHGFWYDQKSKTPDGIYNDFLTFEISSLPPGWAANPYTSFNEVKQMNEKTLNDAHRKVLQDIGWSDELIAKFETAADVGGKELEEKGVRFKTTSDEINSEAKMGKDMPDKDKEKKKPEEKKTAAQGTEIGELLTAMKTVAESVNSLIERQDAYEKALDAKIEAQQKVFEQVLGSTPRATRSQDTKIETMDDILQYMVDLQNKQQTGEQLEAQGQGAKSVFGNIWGMFPDGGA